MKLSARTIMAFAAAALALPALAQQESIEQSDFGRWYISPGVGFAKFEGDEVLKDGLYLTMRLGYDYSEMWSFEGSFLYAWQLKERLGGYIYKDKNTREWRDHYPVRYSYAERHGGDRDFGDTWMAQLYFDALFHFTRFEKIDPYLTIGVGGTYYGVDVSSDGPFAATARAGGGLMFHLSDSWTLRLDSRVNVGGYNTEFSQTYDVGFLYRFSANKIKKDPGVNKINPVESISKDEPKYNEIFRFNIEFDTADDAIKPIYNEQLDYLANHLAKSPASTAVIEGHADRRQLPQPSGHEYNMRLSERRAIAVRDYLVVKGVQAQNLTPIGYGFTRPIAENDPVDGNAKNRRVDVKVNNKGS